MNKKIFKRFLNTFKKKSSQIKEKGKILVYQ